MGMHHQALRRAQPLWRLLAWTSSSVRPRMGRTLCGRTRPHRCSLAKLALPSMPTLKSLSEKQPCIHYIVFDPLGLDKGGRPTKQHRLLGGTAGATPRGGWPWGPSACGRGEEGDAGVHRARRP